MLTVGGGIRESIAAIASRSSGPNLACPAPRATIAIVGSGRAREEKYTIGRTSGVSRVW